MTNIKIYCTNVSFPIVELRCQYRYKCKRLWAVIQSTHKLFYLYWLTFGANRKTSFLVRQIKEHFFLEIFHLFSSNLIKFKVLLIV